MNCMLEVSSLELLRALWHLVQGVGREAVEKMVLGLSHL
jgi:hypothetical protein